MYLFLKKVVYKELNEYMIRDMIRDPCVRLFVQIHKCISHFMINYTTSDRIKTLVMVFLKFIIVWISLFSITLFLITIIKYFFFFNTKLKRIYICLCQLEVVNIWTAHTIWHNNKFLETTGRDLFEIWREGITVVRTSMLYKTDFFILTFTKYIWILVLEIQSCVKGYKQEKETTLLVVNVYFKETMGFHVLLLKCINSVSIENKLYIALVFYLKKTIFRNCKTMTLYWIESPKVRNRKNS